MNPIVRRELLELLRTRRATALQLSLALLCAVLVLVRWPTASTSDLSGARSLEVLRMFGYGLLAGVLLLVPAFPATSLVREKIKGTLALLLNSPMRPWSIYLGKLGGILGFTAILLVMTMPAAAACYALGGTGSRGGILNLYAILALAAVQLSTLGLLVSCHSRSTDGALRGSYALVLVVCVLTLGPYELFRGQSGIEAQVTSWLRCLSPIPAVMEALGQGDVGSHGMVASSSAIGRYALLASFFSLVCAAATISRLNHHLLDQARSAGVMTEDRTTEQRIVRRLFFLVDPQRRSQSMSLWVNPVMVKEFRSRRFGRSHWMLRLIATCAILSLGLSYIAAAGVLGWGVEVVFGALVLLQIALLILFAPSLAAGLVSSERGKRIVAVIANDAADSGRDPARQTAERGLAAVLALVRHPARLRCHDCVSSGPDLSVPAHCCLSGPYSGVRRPRQCRRQHPVPLDRCIYDRFLPGAAGRVPGTASDLVGKGSTFRPRNGAGRPARGSGGRCPASRRCARIQELRVVAL